MTAKRSNGEGSNRKRPNGTWEARLVFTDEVLVLTHCLVTGLVEARN